MTFGERLAYARNNYFEVIGNVHDNDLPEADLKKEARK
jgi:hypothetical protein